MNELVKYPSIPDAWMDGEGIYTPYSIDEFPNIDIKDVLISNAELLHNIGSISLSGHMVNYYREGDRPGRNVSFVNIHSYGWNNNRSLFFNYRLLKDGKEIVIGKKIGTIKIELDLNKEEGKND